MIIVRSPLRITLGGGGTDLPSYYSEHEGLLISAAIDKYVYVSVIRPFAKGIYLKYSQLEHVEKVDEVQHKIIREVLSMENLKTPQIEITTLADIPSGTGLGSSGSFTTALLKAVYTHRKKMIHQDDLAKLACQVEIERLQEPIGKQDQYASAIGGVNIYKFMKDGSVTYNPLNISVNTLHFLEDNLLMFYTGTTRSAGKILKDQNLKSLDNNQQMLTNLHYVKKLGVKSKDALERGDVILFGQLMHEHWQYKKNRSPEMSNPEIDHWYDLAINNGAVGGKLVGAGGGGFLMFLAKDKQMLRLTMSQAGLEEVRFKFDFEGTKVIMSS
jgi:D-glycero-alpha-D-manno-heptose-7-phosphate kinase